jgi:hypothetical protein
VLDFLSRQLIEMAAHYAGVRAVAHVTRTSEVTGYHYLYERGTGHGDLRSAPIPAHAGAAFPIIEKGRFPMSTKNKKKAPSTNAVAKLDEPLSRKNYEELITVTRHQLDAIKAASAFPTTPPVQTAVTTLGASTDAFDKLVSDVNAKKAELATLMGARDTQHGVVMRDRATLRGVITTAAQGSSDAIKAWNCFVRTSTTLAPSQDPPEHLTLKTSNTTPGAIEAKCKPVKGGAAYLFAIATDSNAAPGAGVTVTGTTSKCEIPGLTVGHLVSVRVAVVRRGGEQSRWSEPVQILVR